MRIIWAVPSIVIFSPGRIELLGNHTDHNNGKVLVSSVNLKILAAVAPRDDKKIVIFSKGYKKIQVSLNALKKREKEFGKSVSIVRGVTARFKKLGYKIGGFSVCCDSSIYNGAGVSSSAAFDKPDIYNFSFTSNIFFSRISYANISTKKN